jgi:hypothetical protein
VKPVRPKREGASLYFDRQPDEKPDEIHDRVRQPTFGNADRAALQRVERRLGEVEHKLDRILEALKSRTP